MPAENHLEYVNDLDLPLEALKNRFLAAIYRQDSQQARQTYLAILDHAGKALPAAGETQEKILRQVQTAFLRFRKFLTDKDTALAVPFQEMRSLLAGTVKSCCAEVHHVSYEDWASALDLMPWQMDRVFENAITVQLTSGCSNYCRRCNEWALPGIRAHFSYPAAQKILARLADKNNTDAALYGASDPLDWEDGSHTLAGLLAQAPPGISFSLLTKVPHTRQAVMKRLIRQGVDLSVSITDKNRDRVYALEKETGIGLPKQHDSDDLLIPAGLDEDFISIKSSITDAYGTEITPEEASIIIPTFTSALHPMGHKKLPVTRKTPFFPVRQIGRQALLKDYFKPLEVVGRENILFHLTELLDVQTETLLLDNGSMDLSPPGMRNLKEYFTIFEEPARQRRKQMTRSVLQGLKQQFLPNGRYRDLTPEQQQRYRQKIVAHLEFCDKDKVVESRICATTYFFKSTVDYLAGRKDRKTIIAHLVKTEAGKLESRYGHTARKTDPEHLLSTATDNFFDRFRFYLTSMVFDRHTDAVTRFIQANPSAYDPAADRFVPPRGVSGCI